MRHAGGVHLAPSARQAARQIDAAAGGFDHRRAEAEAAGVECRPQHAEIGGKAADVHLLHAAGGQPAIQPRAGGAIRLQERRVGIHLAVPALQQDQLRVRHRKPRGEGRPALPCTQWSGHSVCSP